MSYHVKDLIYANRWVNLPSGTIAKFLNELCIVADKDIAYFKKNKEFVILEQLSVDKKEFTTRLHEPKEDLNKIIEDKPTVKTFVKTVKNEKV